MKFNFKSAVAGAVVGATITASVPVMARSGSDMIDIVWRDIKICVDGVQMMPRDSVGKELEPFVYNGTTYLPVRAVAEAVGKDVTWDSQSSTVYIGKSGVTKYLGQQVTAYKKDAMIKEGSAIMGGTNYLNSLYMYGLRAGSNDIHEAYYNINGLYSSMNGMYGTIDENTHDCDCTVYIYGDDVLLKTLECKGGAMPKNFNVDITGVVQLKVQFRAEEIFYGCLGDVTFQ
ncbi:MAG: NPCBM/NEW2 domain-containing protein [Firmicutes bacterium]|nr:NPCBM/NEW2 domain-containing protein [Bacillota bacterium]